MRWPFRKLHGKGKRRHSQRQSHRRNVERELRNIDWRRPKRRRST